MTAQPLIDVGMTLLEMIALRDLDSFSITWDKEHSNFRIVCGGAVYFAPVLSSEQLLNAFISTAKYTK